MITIHGEAHHSWLLSFRHWQHWHHLSTTTLIPSIFILEASKMVSNPFFLHFDFYSALFGDLGFVCWALDCVYRLWRCWACMVLIWTANLFDLGLHIYWILNWAWIIGCYCWGYLNFFDFCWLGFSWCLDRCFGTVLRVEKNGSN